MSDKIVWLAAYPKTGSTWVRAILHQMLASKLRPVEAIRSFDTEYPEDAPWYRLMGAEAKLLRTHCHVDHPAFQRLQKQRSDEVIGVITVQRHPLDVLLSQLNYSFNLDRAQDFKDRVPKKVEQIIADGEMDYYIDAFIDARGCPGYLGRCGTYPEFYSGWEQFAPAAKHLHLRYEDLVQDRTAGVKAMIDFLERRSLSASRIAETVEERTQVNGKFFWRKQAYNFQSLLDAAAIERFESGFADGLESLGYASTVAQSGFGRVTRKKAPSTAAARASSPAKVETAEDLGATLQALAAALQDRETLEDALATALRTGDELMSHLREQQRTHAEQLKNAGSGESRAVQELRNRLAFSESQLEGMRLQLEGAAEELKRLKQKYRLAQAQAQSEKNAHASTRRELDRLSGALPVRAYRATASLLRGAGGGAEAARDEAMNLIRNSGLFDANWYRSRYPDVADDQTDPLAHFVDHGWKEGRNPGPNFAIDEYLRRNPHVAQTGENPLLHHIRAGSAGHAVGQSAGESGEAAMVSTNSR